MQKLRLQHCKNYGIVLREVITNPRARIIETVEIKEY